MKLLVSTILAFSATAAFSVEEANHFVCKGKQVSVVMDTSSKTGAPLLSILGDQFGQSVNLVQVELTDSPMGQQVSGFFDGIADANMTYTLIVPRVLVKIPGTQKIEGMLARTFTGGLMAPNTNESRVVESNSFMPVRCVAQVVRF
ncbi:MAG: hypothetical protein NT027_20525 [Proteobacteria bacterium]|nr:hypothetical protein [Pseudomonadota bacterium]